VGQYLIPGGTQIDLNDAAWAWLSEAVSPPNAQALDQEAYDLLAQYYPGWQISTPMAQMPQGGRDTLATSARP
jgi:hypothetical protein